MEDVELAWLAGLLEGEGSFTVHKNQKSYTWAEISLSMCDEDVILRAAAILGLPPSRVHRMKTRCQDQFRLTIGGKAAVALMRRLLPIMGIRRSKRINELLCQFGHR